MLKWLLCGGAVVALADPYLLYLISESWGFWAAFGVWLAPLALGSILLAPLARRTLSVMPHNLDFSSIPIRLAELFLLPTANFLLWYPGPVSSFIGILLLIGPFRRSLARQLVGSAGSRFGGTFNIGRGTPASVFAGAAPPGIHPERGAPGGLKQADGRVVEDGEPPAPENPQLPEAGASGSEHSPDMPGQHRPDERR